MAGLMRSVHSFRAAAESSPLPGRQDFALAYVKGQPRPRNQAERLCSWSTAVLNQHSNQNVDLSARTDRERLENRYQHGIGLLLRKKLAPFLCHLFAQIAKRTMGRSRGFRKSKGICTPTSGIVRQIGGTALCINGTRDHVHLLIRMSTHHSIADIAHR